MNDGCFIFASATARGSSMRLMSERSVSYWNTEVCGFAAKQWTSMANFVRLSFPSFLHRKQDDNFHSTSNS